MGKQAVDAARRGVEAGCEWFVADAESHYCFWRFLEDRGDGKPVPPAKIAAKLMIDDTQVKKVFDKFKKDFKEILFS
jgi:hypothetical protein